MTGRIIYTPTPLHDCRPPGYGTARIVTEALTGSKWQCDDCWQIWSLDPGGWRRDGNPHCAVVANQHGELVDVPDPAFMTNAAMPNLSIKPFPRLPDPFPTPSRPDYDAKLVTETIVGFVVLVMVVVVIYLAATGKLS